MKSSHQTALRAGLLALAISPLVGHAQMQSMSNDGLRDVSGQGTLGSNVAHILANRLNLQSRPINKGNTWTFRGRPIASYSFHGGFGEPGRLSVTGVAGKTRTWSWNGPFSFLAGTGGSNTRSASTAGANTNTASTTVGNTTLTGSSTSMGGNTMLTGAVNSGGSTNSSSVTIRR
jgi:hypothetical protein